jgi:transposase
LPCAIISDADESSHALRDLFIGRGYQLRLEIKMTLRDGERLEFNLMKGCPPAGRYNVRWWISYKETAMNEVSKLACVGLDCHRNFSLASARDEAGRIAWRRRLGHVDRNAVKKELLSWPEGVPVILEGTFGWGWMSDELREAKLDAHLSSGRKVAVWRAARNPAKSNKKDADLLSELWFERPRMEGGVMKRWWEVWCPPPAVRDQREWLRDRMSLVAMQTAMKNQVHATLHRHGLVQPFSDLFGVAGRKWLGEVCADEASLMRPSGRKTLAGFLAMLQQLRRQIAAATRQFRTVIRRSPDVKRLTTLPGVCTVLAFTIAAEIGRHVGKAGRRTLKWAWIEAAHNAVRKSPRMKKVFDRHTDNGKYNRGRGYIVVAHQMCLIGYAMWKKQTDYQETPPPGPGQRNNAIEHSNDEFIASTIAGSEGKESENIPCFKESDETSRMKRQKKTKKVRLVRERTSPKCAMATQTNDSIERSDQAFA